MTCSHQQCQNIPEYQPVLETRSRAGGKTTRVYYLELAYCGQHQASYKLENILSDEAFTKLVKFVREKGFPPPERPLTTLGWKKLDEDDLADLEDGQQHTDTGEDELAF